MRAQATVTAELSTRSVVNLTANWIHTNASLGFKDPTERGLSLVVKGCEALRLTGPALYLEGRGSRVRT